MAAKITSLKKNSPSKKRDFIKATLFWTAIFLIVLSLSLTISLAINGTYRDLASVQNALSVLTPEGIGLFVVLGISGFLGIIFLIAFLALFFLDKNNKNISKSTNKKNYDFKNPIDPKKPNPNLQQLRNNNVQNQIRNQTIATPSVVNRPTNINRPSTITRPSSSFSNTNSGSRTLVK